MARSEAATDADGRGVERAARLLDVDGVSDVARAALDGAGGPALRRCGRGAAVVAALRLAARRGGRVDLDLEDACEAFGVHPGDALRAEELLRAELSPPAGPEAVSRLRRGVNAVREVLLAKERGRTNAPRLPPGVLADAAPALAGRPLETVDGDELRAHLRRLEGDLEMARLGVRLYALVHG
ncbi:hypothetical protein [Salinilacihabitans rarus]|uniref:hypothetical protein n=1 Tax=Salinilacihabitans rarus TaxID=2961596 RepID=UPI0020C8B415|nr:hypothetical protein [Salinilacihabitans rarus]